MTRSTLRQQAIKLRISKGLSYSEINKKLGISKSTLSYWLRDIVLPDELKKRLKKRIGISQPMAAKAHRDRRVKKTKEIVQKAKKQIKFVDNEKLFYLGIALYWAEGSKQKKHNVGQRVIFNNSDPLMIKIYIRWLLECVGINKENLDFEIYSHENIRDKEKDVVKYWSLVTDFPQSRFKKIYYKKDKKNKYRKNQRSNYFGLLRIIVRKSTDLNRKISGWIEGVCLQCGLV